MSILRGLRHLEYLIRAFGSFKARSHRIFPMSGDYRNGVSINIQAGVSPGLYVFYVDTIAIKLITMLPRQSCKFRQEH